MPSHLIFHGLIDCHVHFREPGNTAAENMASGSLSAWNGGVVTVCDMPNTEPATCTVDALREKIERAKRRGALGVGRGVDIRFFFGVTKQEHLEELKKVSRNDIVGVKLYFDHSTGNQKADEEMIAATFALCAKLDILVVCHCEDAEINARFPLRPPESEVRAVEHAISLAKKHGTRLHIAHISTAGGVDLVRMAKTKGIAVTCEAAPHHLFLTVDDYEELGSLAKMNPPLRTLDHVASLWEGISDGTIDCIASDHAPHTIAAKRGANPPSGVPGTETMLPLLLSCMSSGPKDSNGRSRKPENQKTLQSSDIIRLLHDRPNEIFRLGKAGQSHGKPEQTVIVDPGAVWTIRAKDLHSKCGWTPYEGWEVIGKVVRVDA